MNIKKEYATMGQRKYIRTKFGGIEMKRRGLIFWLVIICLSMSGCGNLSDDLLPDKLEEEKINVSVDEDIVGNTYVEKDYEYTILEDMTVEISAYIGNEKTVTVPETIGDYQVTRIGTRAFEGTDIESITIPKGVETIGERAFQSCVNLKRVKISDGVRKAEWGIFNGSDNIISIEIPDSLIYVDGFGLNSDSNLYRYYGGLKYLGNIVVGFDTSTIKEGKTEISFDEETTAIAMVALRAESYMITNTDIIFPESLKVIGQDAFAGQFCIETMRFLSEPECIENCGINSKIKIYGPECDSIKAYSVKQGNQYVIVE